MDILITGGFVHGLEVLGVGQNSFSLTAIYHHNQYIYRFLQQFMKLRDYIRVELFPIK